MTIDGGEQKLLEAAKTAAVQLPVHERAKLVEMLTDYCAIYYGDILLTITGMGKKEEAMDWAIKRIEQRLNPKDSSTGKLVVGDGTWLANARNYYNTLVQSKPDIGDYLREYHEKVYNYTDAPTPDKGTARK